MSPIENQDVQEKKHDPVTEFYASYNESNRDMATLEHGRAGIPFFLRITALLILVACIAAAWIGYQSLDGRPVSFFNFGKKNSYIDVAVSLDRQGVIPNGLLAMRVTIKNTSNDPLDPVSAIIDYPKEFAFIQSAPYLPKNEQKNFWQFGSLTAGQEIVLTILGHMGSDPAPQEQTIHTTVFYKPVNLSTEFKAQSDTLIVMSQPQFRLRIDGPPEVEKGVESTYTIAFHPNGGGSASLDGFPAYPLELIFDYPKNFLLKETKPTHTKEKMRWDISQLWSDSPEGTGSVDVIGSFIPEGVSTPLTAKIGYFLGEEFIVLDQTEYLPSLAVPFEKNLQLSLSVAQKESPVFLIPLDPEAKATVPVSIAYQNNGKITLQNVSFTLSIPKNDILLPIPDEWNMAKSEPSFPYFYNGQNDSQIRITPDEVPSLQEIGPSASGTIILLFRTRDYQSIRSLDPQNTSLNTSTAIRLSAEIGGPSQRSLHASDVSVTLASDTSLRVNTSQGNGSIAVEWIIENTFHELENIRVTAPVPEPLAWTDNTLLSAGVMKYTPDTREVLWSINRLPRGVKSVSARFELEGSFGQSESTGVVTLTAKDKTTGSLISIQKNLQ